MLLTWSNKSGEIMDGPPTKRISEEEIAIIAYQIKRLKTPREEIAESGCNGTEDGYAGDIGFVEPYCDFSGFCPKKFYPDGVARMCKKFEFSGEPNGYSGRKLILRAES